ncbi:MAG TPA: hypothetical protein VE200_15645 [Xanthobacteraceae bacterium]|jgi:hypothetical protein|nr:hypothetical protein [Xanthobacteraceae bacterium]
MYGDVLPDIVLYRAGVGWPKLPAFPAPSQLFVGLDRGLDHRLIRDHRDKDVTLCQALAAVPTAQQQEFYELYLVDPADARHWAALPRWKRPIRKGNTDDQQIWKFFTIQHLCMEQAASNAPPWAMSSQGAQLSQTFGTIAYLTPEGLKKLVTVMGTYGDMLQYGRDLGDVTKKPWEEK